MNDQMPAPQEVASPQRITFGTIMPAAMAVIAEENGVRRATTDLWVVLVLSILAGAFISFGAIFATTVNAGNMAIVSTDGSVALSTVLPYGVSRLLMGLVFSLGLLLVIIGGAELFTGNNMIVMAWASRRFSTRALLVNWGVAFLGNAAGAIATAIIMFTTTQYTFGNGAVGHAALSIAQSKTSLTFVPAFALGIMCNVLVCLAVWMCYGARTTV